MQEILESNLNLKIEFLLIWLAQISARMIKENTAQNFAINMIITCQSNMIEIDSGL